MRLGVYVALKMALLIITLLLSNLVLGSWIWMALAIAATIEFDYWDHYIEIIAILAIAYGNVPLIVVATDMWRS